MYDVVNTMIIEKLKEGTLPWKQTWSNYGPARNYVSKKAYRGVNAIILNNTEFQYPLYLTFLQVKALGGHIVKGSKSIEVIYWKTLEFDSDDSIKRIPYLRHYNVFNIEHIRGVNFRLPLSFSNDPIEACDTIISDMPLRPQIKHGGDQPCYNWMEDRVNVPYRESFITSDEYYATLFHELAHSTGHTSRLHRATCMTSSVYGSEQYCTEELVAELATCFLCAEAGIGNTTIDNSSAYINFWLERLTHILKQNNKAFVHAASMAQKAADWILRRKASSVEN